MNKTKKLMLTLLGILGLLVTPLKARAGSWQNLTGTYNLNSRENVLRFQRGTNNTYGFLDLYGKKVNFETMYGEARARKNIGKGFSVGAEANFGTDITDIVKPHGAYSKSAGPAILDIKYSPIESTGETKQELGIYVLTNIRGIDVEGWGDIAWNPKTGEITKAGEIEASKKLGAGTSLVGRVESYPWKSSGSLQFSIGIKKDL